MIDDDDAGRDEVSRSGYTLHFSFDCANEANISTDFTKVRHLIGEVVRRQRGRSRPLSSAALRSLLHETGHDRTAWRRVHHSSYSRKATPATMP